MLARHNFPVKGFRMTQLPTIGRIVHYRLTEQQATEINRRRTTGASIAERIKVVKWPLGAQAHIGNEAHEGDMFPGMIVRVWGSDMDSSVQLQVFLDGNDVLWATSVKAGDGAGTWSWPMIAKVAS